MSAITFAELTKTMPAPSMACSPSKKECSAFPKHGAGPLSLSFRCSSRQRTPHAVGTALIPFVISGIVLVFAYNWPLKHYGPESHSHLGMGSLDGMWWIHVHYRYMGVDVFWASFPYATGPTIALFGKHIGYPVGCSHAVFAPYPFSSVKQKSPPLCTAAVGCFP